MKTMTFTHHSAVITVPRLVTTEPVRVTTNREQLEALADEMIRRERQRNLDAQSEVFTEGRCWANRNNRHDD